MWVGGLSDIERIRAALPEEIKGRDHVVQERLLSVRRTFAHLTRDIEILVIYWDVRLHQDFLSCSINDNFAD